MKAVDGSSPNFMPIGFHVSIAGGFSLAVRRAFELGCTCMQIFSRNPRGWTVKPLNPDDVAEFKKLRDQWGIGPVFVHTNYLINLASQQSEIYCPPFVVPGSPGSFFSGREYSQYVKPPSLPTVPDRLPEE